MARIRNTKYNTVHHLTSRIAHRAYFLKEDERNDFIDLMLRVSVFSGVELLGWCVLDNHFHIFVYLPVPPVLSDEEVLARFRQLKGDSFRLRTDESDDRIVNEYERTGAECQTPRASLGPGCEEARAKLIRSIRRRMYSIAESMRMIKMWFSDAYNERNCHKGTMWEAVYGDRFLVMPEEGESLDDLRDILAYVHLNSVRAAVADSFDGYPWSSYSAFRRGECMAVAAIRRLYPGFSDEEIVEAHEARMSLLLEDWKFRRAKEIAHKRMAGYEVPADRLTDECMVAQARAQIEMIQRQVMDMQLERNMAKSGAQVRSLIIRQVLMLASVRPDSTPQTLSEALKVPLRTIQRYIEGLTKSGALNRQWDGWHVRDKVA